MKKSFYIATMTIAIVMTVGVAMAETVDIGMGRMDRAEFERLQQMVSGEYQPVDSDTTDMHEKRHLAEFNEADVEALRQAMASDAARQEAVASTSSTGLVDIGTGSMPNSEFCDLNKLVANAAAGQTGGFGFVCP